MKVGDLVWLNGTNREIRGIILTADVDYSEIFWDTGRLSWEDNSWLEVINESR